MDRTALNLSQACAHTCPATTCPAPSGPLGDRTPRCEGDYQLSTAKWQLQSANCFEPVKSPCLWRLRAAGAPLNRESRRDSQMRAGLTPRRPGPARIGSDQSPQIPASSTNRTMQAALIELPLTAVAESNRIECQSKGKCTREGNRTRVVRTYIYADTLVHNFGTPPMPLSGLLINRLA